MKRAPGMLTLLVLALFVLQATTGCGGPAEPPAPPAADAGDSEPAPPAAPEAVSLAVGEPVEASPPMAEINADGKLVWRPDLWKSPPRGLPPVPDPAYNGISVEKVELGRLLYFDKRLSKDGTVSCASCHHPATGFSNAQRFAAGIGGQLGGRNSPTVYNAAYQNETFWDGRAKSLEEQAMGPIENPIEMGQPLHEMIATVNAIPDYKPLFVKAFDNRKINENWVVQAIAAFERTILTGDAPFDRFRAGDNNALSEGAQRGLAVFEGKGRCLLCHMAPLFTDNVFHNLGVASEGDKADAGRMDVTKNEKDWGKFKTPTLRNVSVTGPYMHDGSETTLESIVELYDKGGVANKNLDPLMQPLGLTPEEKADLVTFMKEGLTREIEILIPPSAEAASN
ncbi:MAG: cytochrome c peroxidase [Deltaproteobacteria bacterium]|nr:cytochrome c peroxidase [Deltaproteobacteria bacterium]